MEKIVWSTQTRKLKDLVPASYNPRKLSEKAYKDLRTSLEKFNLADLPSVNINNTVISGHQRLRVLTDMYGLEHEIEVRVPNRQLTEEEEKELNIRSNKNTGEWDWDTLANNFDADELLNWGFEEHELSYFGGDDKVEMDRDDLTKTMDSYLDGNVRQVVLYFSAEQYDDVIPRLEAVMQKENLPSHTDAFLKLLEFYENFKA